MVFHNINLTLFRSYEALRLDFQGRPQSLKEGQRGEGQRGARHIVLTGANGAGKTNILEALSLMAPGRGLRGAGLLEMRHRAAQGGDVWGVAAQAEVDGVSLRLGSALDRGHKKRIVRIDGKDASAQSALAEMLSIVWLTPQMDGLFIEGAQGRRKFLDRLVLSFDPAHAGRLTRLEKNLRQRMKILQGEVAYDARWLGTLEQGLAQDSVAIAHARKDIVTRLLQKGSWLSTAAPLFPVPHLGVEGFAETALETSKAIDVEEALQKRFFEARPQDTVSGKTSEGAQRSDFTVSYAAKDMPAAQCSTGEQKGLMVSIMLAHASAVQGEKGHAPILLLDEVAAHLDAQRRAQLFDILGAMNGQVFLTGTDAQVFEALTPKDTLFLHVTQGRVQAAQEMPRATAVRA